MATETELFPDGTCLELSRQEAVQLVTSLTAQLVDGQACIELRVVEGGGVRYLRSFVLDDKLGADGWNTQEIRHDNLRIITLNRRRAADIIALLGAQLAGVGHISPQVPVFRDGVYHDQMMISLA